MIGIGTFKDVLGINNGMVYCAEGFDLVRYNLVT